MKILKFTNADLSLDVEYAVDLIGSNEAMTVYQVAGLENIELTWGLQFRRLSYNLGAFKAFATTNNLKLEVLENGQATSTLVALATSLAITTASIKNGTDGVVDVQTITLPTTAGATQGDYILITNWNGETAAVWLDIDAAGTVPTGAKYLAADYQVRVPIVTGGLAPANGTAFYDAILGEPTEHHWTFYVSIVDNLDGTVEFTQTRAGVVAAADPEDEDDSGVGSITVVVDTTGVDGEVYDEQVVAEGGNTPYTYAAGGTMDLPAGLTFNTVTGKLEGVATALISPATLDVDIIDAFGITVSDQFAFNIT